MSEDLTKIPEKVAGLVKEVEELKRERLADAANIQSLREKALVQGKMGLLDLVKLGAFVVSIAGGVSWVGQQYVQGQLAGAIREVQVEQARTAEAVWFLKRSAGFSQGRNNEETGGEE